MHIRFLYNRSSLIKMHRLIDLISTFRIDYFKFRRGEVSKKLFPNLQHDSQTATPTPTGPETKVITEKVGLITSTPALAATVKPTPMPKSRPEITPPEPPQKPKFEPNLLKYG